MNDIEKTQVTVDLFDETLREKCLTDPVEIAACRLRQESLRKRLGIRNKQVETACVP